MAFNPGIQILLTRPEAQSAAYAAELQQEFAGKVTILQSPLLDIVPIKTPINLKDVHHLLFTSANGVRAFCQLSKRRDIPCLCVGDKTAEVARAQGLAAVSAGGDVQDLTALMQQYADTKDGQFLYLRGQHTARVLAGNVRHLVIYDQIERDLTDVAKAALTDDKPVLVPLFSPRSADLFTQQVSGLMLRNARAICLSGNIAARLDPSLFSDVRVASQPTAKAVTREIAASV
jgi:uroporphyrinogen-III synthase